MTTRRPTLACLSLALAPLALAGCAEPATFAEPTVLVWRVQRGDVVARGNALAARLGLPPLAPGRMTGVAESSDGLVTLRLHLDSGRLTYARGGVTMGPPAIDAAVAVARAGEALRELDLLPITAASCTAWATCPAVAVHVFGLSTPDDAPPAPGTGAGDHRGGAAEAPGPDAPAPIEVAFTPRLPVRYDARGEAVWAELAGGAADLVVRLTPDGAVAGIDARFQPVDPDPIEVPARALADALAEYQPDERPDDWRLIYQTTPLLSGGHHGPGGVEPLRFYYPMHARLLDGPMTPVAAVPASRFVPRLADVRIPDELDDRTELALAFDRASGSGRIRVAWYAARATAPEQRWYLGEDDASILVDASTRELRRTLALPDGDYLLTLDVRDDAGPHYTIDNLPVRARGSGVTDMPGVADGRDLHTGWQTCSSGSLSYCHAAAGVRARHDCMGDTCTKGVVPTVVESMRSLPGQLLTPNTIFIKDLSVRQFHLDMKIRVPERKRDLARGWAEDWPRAGDMDAGESGGARYKDFWIRTDTCKLDAANKYLCEIVPRDVSPTNPHRKMGVLCPDRNGEPREAGSSPVPCTEPRGVSGGYGYTRTVTGVPGRLVLEVKFSFTNQLPGDAPSAWQFKLGADTILRLKGPNGAFDQETTDRMISRLGATGQLQPAVVPEVTWRWEGDQPRERVDGAKQYGGNRVECYNVLEVCRRANDYDPRPRDWAFTGHRVRDAYPEARLARPWESMLPARDRVEGDARPYCPHELYKVLKERFCPCDDDGTPDETVGANAARPNPLLEVREVRLGLYEKMVPFDAGHAGSILIAEMKELPEKFLGLEGHAGWKQNSVVPSADMLTPAVPGMLRIGQWVARFFLWVNDLMGWVNYTHEFSYDTFIDWIDVFHFYAIQERMPIVRPLARVAAGPDGVPSGANAHYLSDFGAEIFYRRLTEPPLPGRPFGYGDKSTYQLPSGPYSTLRVPDDFATKGFWQNLHFKSIPPPATGQRNPYIDVVVPGCQSLFPLRKGVGGGNWVWDWDRALCVHHHESWFKLLDAFQQKNHDIAWMLGQDAAGAGEGGNPKRVGTTYPGTTLYIGRREGGIGPVDVYRLNFWEFTVTRAFGTETVGPTLNTPFFFTQGPLAW